MRVIPKATLISPSRSASSHSTKAANARSSLSKEVKAEAERAIALNPNEDLAWHVLGIWNREMVELNWFLRKFAEMLYGRFPAASMEVAITNLSKAVELAPDRVAHHVELGITLADARQWNEANKELQQALSMPKTWVTDEYYRGLAKKTLEELKQHEKPL